ncbi:hypothetical protein [Brumimicrobium sp.]|uniref:hypothetical protein n=1 Tax=Brumimicrobium sp. TaxID=2029867 RepID=UPI003A8E3118
MKNILFLLLLFLIGCSNSKSSIHPLPKKLSKLPIGIKVIHSEDMVYASLNEDQNRGQKYKWNHSTTVSTLKEELTIVEFGGYVYEDNSWKEKNIEFRPFNNQEFEDWYKCPKGILLKNKTYTDNNNWSTADELINSSTIWYFIGEDKNGKKFVGYEFVEIKGELK